MSNDYSELIARLRHLADTYYLSPAIDEGLSEAADALEAQSREIEALRKPLTDEQIRNLWFAAQPTEDGRSASWNFARAIEAAHGIGGPRNE